MAQEGQTAFYCRGNTYTYAKEIKKKDKSLVHEKGMM
jgi:hypothetical protein